MSAITFSSGVYVDAASTTTTRFTTFTLNADNDEFLTQIVGRLGGKKPIQFMLQGPNLLARLSELEAVEALELLNGAPRTTLAGCKDAVMRSGELLNIAATLQDGTERNEWGVIAALQPTTGPGGPLAQRVDFVFHPCDRVRFVNSSTYLTAPTACSGMLPAM